MTAQFHIRDADASVVALIQREVGLPHFIATTLAARGIDDVPSVMDFLHPSLEKDWLDPYIIPGISDVADLLEQAVRRRDHVIVFGDFDLDGISATTVLTRALRALGGLATPFIPRRFEEGYGLTSQAFQRVKQLDPALIVTVDCGISCRDEVAAIVADGVRVAITDHHEAADQVPEHVPVADPKLDDSCPSCILAGVGVALKLVQILGGRMGYPHLWRSYTDFATLGTVADLMPMVGENRALVAEGLQRMNQNPRPCIAALLGSSGTAGTPLTSTNLSFSLVPRLNAAGRMGDAQLALDLLMSDNYAEACALAEKLEEINNQRRAIESELSEIAQKQAEEIYQGQRVLVVSGRGWHEGVKGIVASRLVGMYGVPTLLFTIDGDEARGSGRSVGEVNLFNAVESVSDLLTRFGGHEAAVGVTLPAANLPAFASRLNEYLQRLPESEFHPLIQVDAVVRLPELTLDHVEKLDLMAPFGQENPVPTFMARHVTLSSCRAVGADKNHFSCLLTDGRQSVGGIMFHCNVIDRLMENESVVDAVFSVQIDEWRGRRTVKAMLKSLEPSRMCRALKACLDPEAQSFFHQLFDSDDRRYKAAAVVQSAVQNEKEARQKNRSHWEEVARQDPNLLEDAIVRAIIGPNALHPAQRAILDRLKEGRSTLAVMATGRGKSLTFQVYAAMRALQNHEASLFVYPLRALVADQAFHLSSALEQFGLACAVLTGETSPDDRLIIRHGLMNGSIDIILTTPEFFTYHVDGLAESGRIGFVVVDEAHHIGLAKAGQRVAYNRIGDAIARLGQPTVLAATATAPQEVADDIEGTLPLEDSVIDETARDNLSIDDQRNIRNKDDYLANLIATGEKTVIYVNSREQSVTLARTLRRRVPHLAPLIGFYNAGLSRDERKRIEALFRNDQLMVLVATSAFGEGVDIPNIRHVVLYHMPFNEVEFNQMSGRAGRDGRNAVIHLLYGRHDVAINQRILFDHTPDHDVMVQVYRRLRALQRQNPDDYFPLGNDDLARLASTELRAVSPSSAACGIAVFRELGLIETRDTFEAGRRVRWIRVNENAKKVELTDSVRYREGLDERSIFDDFRDWAMRCDAQGLFVHVCHPIVPRR